MQMRDNTAAISGRSPKTHKPGRMDPMPGKSPDNGVE